MSDKCPINLICTCYVGDDQNECQDMPCYACVLEGKEKAEAERDRLQRDYDDILKWMAESDAGKLAARCKQLREALEKIHRFSQDVSMTPEPLLLHIENIARDALAGGSDQEPCSHCWSVHDPAGPCIWGSDTEAHCDE